jgi:hypothetical protein
MRKNIAYEGIVQRPNAVIQHLAECRRMTRTKYTTRTNLISFVHTTLIPIPSWVATIRYSPEVAYTYWIRHSKRQSARRLGRSAECDRCTGRPRLACPTDDRTVAPEHRRSKLDHPISAPLKDSLKSWMLGLGISPSTATFIMQSRQIRPCCKAYIDEPPRRRLEIVAEVLNI